MEAPQERFKLIKNLPFIMIGLIVCGLVGSVVMETTRNGGLFFFTSIASGIAAFIISKRILSDWYWTLTHGATIVSSTWVIRSILCYS
jgi:uncharacterized membrane protein YeaQ/YmgE (transglycosylase-associated protein family)